METPSVPSFNWELCANLHNEILDVGWAVITEDTGVEPNLNSWWEHYFGSHEDEERRDTHVAEELERRLHPDIVKFLKKARHDYPGTESLNHFFYYLQGLVDPCDMIKVLNNDDDTGLFMIRPPNYVYLYNFPDPVIGGLLLDQESLESNILREKDLEVFEVWKTPPTWRRIMATRPS